MIWSSKVFLPALLLMLSSAAHAAEPVRLKSESGSKPKSASRSIQKDSFEVAGSSAITSPRSGPCEDLAGGGKKCFVPPIGLPGRDWTTVIGTTARSHYVSLDQPTATSVGIEVYFEYESENTNAFDDWDVVFTYRLWNENNSLLATIQYRWWRSCGRQVERKQYTSATPNIDVVQGVRTVDVYADYRLRINWKCQ